MAPALTSTMTTLATLLTDAARVDPDTEALVGLSRRYTWREYDRAAANVAAHLLTAGVGRGDRVAVGFSKDARSFVAIHGCLRIGAIVVPLDPMSPPMAARSVLTDADVAAVFVDARRCEQLDPWSIDGLALRTLVTAQPSTDPRTTAFDDVADRAHPDALAALEQLPPVAADDPAYIIFTSGSTGRSKGIVHTHASAMAYAARAVESRRLTPADRIAGMSPLHFDMSTLELYAAPLARCAVVVVGEAHLRFPASFTSRSQDERVSVWYFVPSFFRLVTERGALDQRDLSALRLVMYGGEPYAVGALAELAAAVPNAVIENIYGPAEVNECTSHVVTPATLQGDDVPVGLPWHGVDLRVVDELDGDGDDRFVDVADGEPGELWVSAPTVMTGYWRRPDLDARSLVLRPGGFPWYRTGDVVVRDPDGTVWFRGRRDHQVKVRGIRLELEAVEAVLTDAPDVVHAVAVPVGDAGEAAHVAAVVVLRDGAALDEAALRAFCTSRLPAVGVPKEFRVVDRLPFTATGKLDRRHVREHFADTPVSTSASTTPAAGPASAEAMEETA